MAVGCRMCSPLIPRYLVVHVTLMSRDVAFMLYMTRGCLMMFIHTVRTIPWDMRHHNGGIRAPCPTGSTQSATVGRRYREPWF